MFERLQHALKHHYSASQDVAFRQFRLGAMLFFAGGVLVYIAVQLNPSLQQELVLLAGLLVGGCGFVVAILAQVRMTISRIWWFFKGD